MATTFVAPPAGPFESAEDVRTAHARLLAELPEHPGPADLARVTGFICRAVATGVVLDAPEERKQVQGLIDYWAASLQTEYREAAARGCGAARLKPSTTVLAEFDPARLRTAAADADAWFAGLSEQDQKIARRIALRLVRLRSAEPVFDLVSVTRGALHYQLPSAEQVDEVLRGLVGVGVVRQTPGKTAADDEFVLRSADFLTDWKALAGWLDERLRFRAQAAEWDAERVRANQAYLPRTVERIDRWLTRRLSKVGRAVDKRLGPPWRWLRRRSGLATPSDRLLAGEELDDARCYHDRSPTEKQFTDESRYRQQLAGDRNRLLLGAFALMFIIAAVGWLFAATGGVFWKKAADAAEHERKVAEEQTAEADCQREIAEEQTREANRLKDIALRTVKLAGVRRNQATKQQRRLEHTEDDLADLLEMALNKPGELAKWRDSASGKRFGEQLQKIRDQQAKVREFQDPRMPLRPGCRVWIDTSRGGPTLCSVCCIVRCSGGADRRRFAVVYCSPSARNSDRRLVMTRLERDGPEARQQGTAHEVGYLVDPEALRTARRPAVPDETIERSWIALAELNEGVPADNRLPTLKRPLAGLLASTPEKKTPVQLLGGTTGSSTGELWTVMPSGLLTYAGETTIGDAGGPILNDRDELLAMRMTALQGDEVQGFLMAGWLEEYGLELVPAPPG
jgi:hypothetical protein